MSEIRQAFANALRQARKVRKLTQHELSEAAGLSVDMISRLERGALAPSFDSVDSLAKALGISPLQFFSQKPLEFGRSRRARLLTDANAILSKCNDDDLERSIRILKAFLGR